MWRRCLAARGAVQAAGLALGLGGLLLASAAAAQDARRISAAEALKAVAEGKAVLVDVRGSGPFEAGHAKGALSIPLGELAARLKELPKDKLIIAYCT
ncbi:MAG TPA: rhodanese-like domain-containing protein [Thermoanaerobaculia bacterium]|nr:rhodanese-like domain-containing protein [Thermoanaerobaculia bacterium]